MLSLREWPSICMTRQAFVSSIFILATFLRNERSSRLCIQLKQLRKESLKKRKSVFNGNRTQWLCDTDAVLLPTKLSRYHPIKPTAEYVIATIFHLLKCLLRSSNIWNCKYSLHICYIVAEATSFCCFTAVLLLLLLSRHMHAFFRISF